MMNKQIKLLVIEDPNCFIQSLYNELYRFGYTFDIAKNVGEAAILVSLNQYDIFVFDVGLIRSNEYSLLFSIRQKIYNAKILILSDASQMEYLVKSIEAGANDYLVKPFTSNELIVRLNTLARCKFSKNTEIQLGSIKIFTSRKKVRCMGYDVELTPSEYKVIEHIALSKGRVISKNQLEDVLYETESNVSSNVVEVIVSNLRKKIKQFGAESPIKTRRGFGYYADI